MPNYARDADIECPFFLSADHTTAMKCEGAFCKSTTHYFRAYKEREQHVTMYCAGNYLLCPYYTLIMAKYNTEV